MIIYNEPHSLDFVADIHSPIPPCRKYQSIDLVITLPINIYILYTPNLELRIAVSDREKKQGRF